MVVGIVGWAIYGLVYVISAIASVAIAFLTFLIGIILQLSTNIVNSFAVQNGFAVTLAVANLGFVLAIIIIAIATILRRESYGIKKVLWKLVLAAIMVNFSLVIGGAFIGFANTLTNTFLTQLPGGQGRQNVGSLAFAEQLAGAFSPQRAFINNIVGSSTISSSNSSSTSSFWSTVGGALLYAVPGYAAVKVAQTAAANLINGTGGQDLASVLTPLIELFCAIAFLVVIVITLAVFLFQLLIRYVMLAFLLILMPFAWLMWLFPKTEKLWHDWWEAFIKWTFFAPIVVFFLWLAITTAQNMNNNSGGDLSFLGGGSSNPYTAEAGKTIFSGFAAALGGFIGTFAVTILQGTVVVGLAVGGMIAADKMSITASKSALGAMQSGSNAVKGWAGRRSKQAVTWPLRTETMRNLSSRLQQRSENPLLRYTGVDYLKHRAGRLLQTGAVVGGEGAIKEAKERYEGLTAEQRLDRLDSAEGPYSRAEILRQIMEDGNLDKLTEAQKDHYLRGPANEARFKRYGSEKLYKELRQKSGVAFEDSDKELKEIETPEFKATRARLQGELRTMRETGRSEEEINRKEEEIRTLEATTGYREKKAERDQNLAVFFEENPSAMSNFFATPGRRKELREEAEKKGRVPDFLTEEKIPERQEAMLRAIADKSLSPHNVSSLMADLSKKNYVDGFKEAADHLRTTDAEGFRAIQRQMLENESLLRWNDRSLGRGTLDINLRTVFRLPPEQQAPAAGQRPTVTLNPTEADLRQARADDARRQQGGGGQQGGGRIIT